MSFKVAVASAGRNEEVLAKSFVIAGEGDALAGYSMLRPSSVYLWEDLHDKILANFKGFTSESLTSMDLFQCKQNQGEALKITSRNLCK
jgi:ATP-dependent protease HslVU (ClpYQ) peptidase subunit